MVIFSDVTLENAPKADESVGWNVGGGSLLPIVVGGDLWFGGCSEVVFRGCTINQTRDYFVSTKHHFSSISFIKTTVNLSGDALTFINTAYGTCAISWYASHIYYNGTEDISKLCDGIQGKDFIFYGTCAGRTWFENLDRDIIPTADNARNIGSPSARFAKGYFASGVITRVDVGDYGGNFANYTPPSGEEGMIIIAIDTNSTNPGKRLYVYANGAWHYVDLT